MRTTREMRETAPTHTGRWPTLDVIVRRAAWALRPTLFALFVVLCGADAEAAIHAPIDESCEIVPGVAANRQTGGATVAMAAPMVPSPRTELPPPAVTDGACELREPRPDKSQDRILLSPRSPPRG